jgi:hypothetical protein
LFFSHHFPLGDLFVLFLSISVHEGDPLTRPLFALAHFRALCCSSSIFPSCFFPSLANDVHIFGFSFTVTFFFGSFCLSVNIHGVIRLALQVLSLVAFKPPFLDFPFFLVFVTLSMA